MTTEAVEALRSSGDRAIELVVGALAGEEVRGWGPSAAAARQLEAALDELTESEQVGLLLRSVERMPELRAAGDRHLGSILYAVATKLYGRDLELDEDLIAHLLRSARHDCGHGADTRPPLDLAVMHQQLHGFSPVLASALNEFVANLPKSTAIKVQTIRRRVGLLRVLELDDDGEHPLDPRWWVTQVRDGVRATTGDERRFWEQLVLSMTLTERMVVPRSWAKTATLLLRGTDAGIVQQRLTEWWPTGPKVWLHGSGGQLLKYLIWTVGIVEHPSGDQLVASLAPIVWTPNKRPMGVLKPAAAHLEGSTDPAAIDARAELLARVDDETPRREPTLTPSPPPASPEPTTGRLARVLRLGSVGTRGGPG